MDKVCLCTTFNRHIKDYAGWSIYVIYFFYSCCPLSYSIFLPSPLSLALLPFILHSFTRTHSVAGPTDIHTIKHLHKCTAHQNVCRFYLSGSSTGQKKQTDIEHNKTLLLVRIQKTKKRRKARLSVGTDLKVLAALKMLQNANAIVFISVHKASKSEVRNNLYFVYSRLCQAKHHRRVYVITTIVCTST